MDITISQFGFKMGTLTRASWMLEQEMRSPKAPSKKMAPKF